MSHADHFLSRLDRVSLPHVELALSLYRDDALIPVAEEDSEHMELYNQTEAARVAVERERRVAGHHANGHHRHDHSGNGHDDAAHRDTARPDQGKSDRRPEIVPPAA